MAFEVISTNQTATYSVDSGDEVVLLPGVNVTSPTYGMEGANDGAMSISVLGTIATYNNGLRLGVDDTVSANLDVMVGTSGQIISQFNNASAIYMQRTDSIIDNNGLISGGHAGISYGLGASGGEVFNAGSIIGRDGDGLSINGISSGIYGEYSITNSGLIRGTARGIDMGAGIDAAFINNSGEITGLFDNGIYVEGDDAQLATITVMNTGEINGKDVGIRVDDQGLDLRNFGVVSGSDFAVEMSDNTAMTNTAFIINGGVMNGHVFLGSAADTYRALGDGMSGTVYGNGGNDTLIGANAGDQLEGGSENDYLRGGAGSDVLSGDSGNDSMLGDAGDDVLIGGTGLDTLRGGAGDDSLDGGADADLMFGNDGHDSLMGGDGADVMSGGLGEDYFEGGTGSDTINGGSGRDEILGGDDGDMLRGDGEADAIYGEGGNDTLQGGSGDDTLAGGLGRDILNGGSGADDFRFTATNQSAVGATRDVIQDFEVGVDTIDLGAMPGVLSYVGGAALPGGGTAAVRAVEVGVNTLVQIDVDGNGSIDSEILLSFTSGVTADDFIL